MLTIDYEMNNFTFPKLWSDERGFVYNESLGEYTDEENKEDILPEKLLPVYDFWNNIPDRRCSLAEYNGRYGVVFITRYSKDFVDKMDITAPILRKKAERCFAEFSNCDVFAFIPPLAPFVDEEPAIMLFVPYTAEICDTIDSMGRMFEEICCSLNDEGLIKHPSKLEKIKKIVEPYKINTKTISAVEIIGYETRVLTAKFKILDETIDIMEAISDACDEYLDTPEGMNCFGKSMNLTNFISYVPDKICRRHGFEKLCSETSDICINWDEELF